MQKYLFFLLIFAVFLFISCKLDPYNNHYDGYCSEIPPEPRNARIRSKNYYYTTIFWDTLQGVDKHEVFRSENENGEYEFIGSSDNRWYHDEVSLDKTYYYKVRTSKYCETHGRNHYSLFSKIPPQLPKPKNVVAEALSAKRIRISWDTVPGIGFMWYEIYASESESNIALLKSEKGYATSRTYIELDAYDVNPSTTYYFRVMALDDYYSASEYSDIVSATTHDMHIAPSGIAVEAISNGEIRVSWNMENNSDEYNIAISEKEEDLDEENIYYRYYRVNPSSYVISELKANTKYYLRVATRRNDVLSKPSDVFSATTLEQLPAPSNLIAEVIPDNKIRLSWEAVEGAERYRIRYSYFDILRSPTFPSYEEIDTEDLFYVHNNQYSRYRVTAVVGNSPNEWAEVLVTTSEKLNNSTER